MTIQDINPKLDLHLERVIDVPLELVWKAWTTPELLMPWFCPLPWKTVACEIDLRPGGRFYTVMQSPEGETYPSSGCYLEVTENQRLIWTSVLESGYRPAKIPESAPGHECAELPMTAMLILEPHSVGTKYTAIVKHADVAGRNRYEAMGFNEGWGAALDQLVAMIKSRKSF